MTVPLKVRLGTNSQRNKSKGEFYVAGIRGSGFAVRRPSLKPRSLMNFDTVGKQLNLGITISRTTTEEKWNRTPSLWGCENIVRVRV